MLQKIVCVTLPGLAPGLAPFEFGVICEVFGIDRSAQGGPLFDFHVVAAEPGPIRTKIGFDIATSSPGPVPQRASTPRCTSCAPNSA